MTLKSVLKPLKWADEQVLRQYTKLTKKWEDKGRNIKLLTLPLNVGGLGIYLMASSLVPSYAFFGGMDLARNIFEKKENITSETRVEQSPIFLLYKKITNFGRLPLFVAGAGMTVKGLADLYNSFINNENIQLNDSFESLKMGLSFLSVSSSIYLKSGDPKLLDKKPFWKTAYEKVRDKVKDLGLKPIPVPVPASNCGTLENYVGMNDSVN